MANIIGTYGDDTLLGSNSADTINGLSGNDTITGGGGNDTFVYNLGDGIDTITDFGGIGKGINPTPAVIAQVDTMKFQGDRLIAKNLLLTQDGNNLKIDFEGVDGEVILQNFALENLENLSKSTGATVNSGNILFAGQTSITDSFDIFNANSTQSTIFNKNTVTFLNDLNNNINGFDNSDDVINGQGGDDIIDGKTGNDLLRGGAGNDTLNGGAGDDYLDDNYLIDSQGDNLLSGSDGNDSLSASGYYNHNTSGNNTLNGGADNDFLDISYSTGNNLLDGADGNDFLYARDSTSNNLLFGGDGNDTLFSGTGNNTLSGGNGNDSFLIYASSLLITQTLDGGTGDDSLGIYVDTTEGITSTFNTTTSIGSITVGTTRLVNYKNIEELSILGTAYDDYIVGTNGNDTLDAGNDGNDTIDGGIGDDLLSVDFLNSTEGITSTFNISTNVGAITVGTRLVNYKNIERLSITGTFFDDYIVGSNGNDTPDPGGDGNDTIDGGTGDDLLSVNFFAPTEGITSTFNTTTNVGSISSGTTLVSYKDIERLSIIGTIYDDYIVGNNGNDILYALAGNDTVIGGKGNDYLGVIGSSSSNNILNGDAGDDTLDAQYSSGDNLLSGGDGNDTLSAYGALGNNTFYGGFGNDYLTSGIGSDTLYGGDGADIFTFNSFNEGVDSLYDFNTTNELIQVSAAGFGGGLSTGLLKASQFTIGTSASNSVQRFIYNSATGELFFDLDGSVDAFTQVKLAQLSVGLSLTENNFVVV
ncbi:MAG: calcium-binding protein [Nostoc sp. S4]|nr:calcium-binding protein [Nostoc sp. S4]